MGKVFSCLPFNKRDSCTGKLPGKKPAGSENERRGHTRNDREKEQDGPERNVADEEKLATKTCRDDGHWTIEDVEQEEGLTVCGDEVVPVRRTKQGYGVWRLEDIEQEQNRDTSTCSETKKRSLSSKSQKRSTDNPPSSTTGNHGRADVTSSPSDPSEVDDRPLSPWTRVEDKPSPRKGAKDPYSIPVSLRQTREEYTKRLTRQRSMTRALFETRSPSPYHRRQMTTSVEKTAIDTDNSQGDTILSKTYYSKHSKDPVVKDDHGINVPHSAKDVEWLDATSSGTVSGVPIDNKLSSQETEHDISEDGLKQIEHDFFEEFTSGEAELTPAPSFLKITGDGDVPDILKEEKLRRLEEAFYQEFPVEDLKIETVPCSLDASKDDILGLNATCDSDLSLEEKTSDDVNDDVNTFDIIEDACSIPDEDSVEKSNYSSEDKTPEPECNGFRVKENDTASVKIDDSTDEIVAIFQMAKEVSEQRNLLVSRKKKLHLIREYKTHDLRPILENTVGERKAESMDASLNIIDMCLDKLIPHTSANHWCSNPDIDVITPDDDDSEASDEDESGADDRLVKLATLFENTIEEEREECEDSCFSLVLQCVDAIDYVTHDREDNHMCDSINASESSVDNCEESDALNNTSNYHACIRRIRSDTDIIIAVDVNGTGHPILVGIGSVIAIDRGGIGNFLNNTR